MFITLEGIDRAGKSTQAARLVASLGERALLLREPGGSEAGERVRRLLIDPALQLAPLSELLLFCAARAELVASQIKPALAAGRIVVCDRFVDSTIAYQGVGRGVGAELARRACEIAIDGCMPDLTLLLWVEPELAAERRRADLGDRFEAAGEPLQVVVAAAYSELAAAEPRRIVRIDAARSPDQVQARLRAVVEQRLLEV